MSNVVAIMDREGWDARTDNLVVVDSRRRLLLWVPRDLWSPLVGARINEAFGRALLREALAQHGIAADGVLCLQRSATERVLAKLRICIPVGPRVEFSYPLEPTERIEDGSMTMCFGPGDDWLEGKRIHAWLGARYTSEGSLSDLERIERQKTFLRRMLEERVDFRDFVSDPAEVSVSSAAVLDDLAGVRADWSFATFGPLENDVRNGAMVLVPRSRSRVVRALRRARFAILRRRQHASA
jgi:hypothetical protein